MAGGIASRHGSNLAQPSIPRRFSLRVTRTATDATRDERVAKSTGKKFDRQTFPRGEPHALWQIIDPQSIFLAAATKLFENRPAIRGLRIRASKRRAPLSPAM
jgi:hypothetical protein